MKKHLVFLLFLGFLLAGCGGSAAPESDSDEMVMADTAAPQVTEACENTMGTACPGEAAPESENDRYESGGSLTGGGEAAEAETSSGSNYFTITRINSVTTGEDGTELLYEYNCDTVFRSCDAETEQWVQEILDQIQKEYANNSANLLQYAEGYLADVGADYFYSFSNYQEVGVARHDTRVVSLLVVSSVYSGGAHPNAVQTAWNLDLEQKRVLRLEDVIQPESAQALAGMVKERIHEKFRDLGTEALFPDYGQTIDESLMGEAMTAYWYLNDQGLVIFFNQYTLGPYAAGIIKTEIPYDELDGILRNEYFPGHYSRIPGDMLLRGDWEGYRKIPITVESDGDRILIGVEGEVYQVQMSEIYWLEGTAIGQRMLFSADRMTQNDVLELIGGYDDETRSFAVEFTDGQGNVVIYYVHPDGIFPEP